ncbi:hypothetical protein GGX14DRAFT_621661 [Mycena pura]|uniref:Uncharacterized protein n=1 Tax=Mycena pura TaxID=153505 RepID=A0AAD6VG42_9AGAR|nr:hypothetical protein GGX14DRAFT_621661 [Mycena pura]
MAPSVDETFVDIGPNASALLDVWIYFNLISNTVLLPILVATFLFSQRAKRHPTLVNVCTTWIFSGVFSLLLFYAGEASGPEPKKGLCVAQTSLLYGITPMWSVAVLVLLCNMNLVMNENPKVAGVGRLKLVAMLSAPYVAQVVFSTATLVASLHHPENVTRSRRVFYCTLHFPLLSLARSLFTGVVGVGVVILMVRLAVLLWRNWHGMRHAGRPSRIDAQIMLRVLIFGAYLVFGLAANIIYVAAPRSVIPDMYAATIGTAIFLVFGTQADVLRTWCFWMSDPPPQTPREALDGVPPPEEIAQEMEKEERSIAWGEV